MVKVVKVFAHVLNDVLNGDVYCVFDDAFVQVADDVLNNAELLEKFSASI